MAHSWESEFLFRIGGNPSGSSWIGVTISNMFVKNMTTGIVTDVTGNFRFSNFTDLNGTCTCNSILLEAHVNAALEPTSLILTYYYVDLIIADTITGNCTSTVEIENKYTFRFVKTRDVRLI